MPRALFKCEIHYILDIPAPPVEHSKFRKEKRTYNSIILRQPEQRRAVGRIDN